MGDTRESGAAIAGLIGRRWGVMHGLIDGEGSDGGEQADNIDCGSVRANNKYFLRMISLFPGKVSEHI